MSVDVEYSFTFLGDDALVIGNCGPYNVGYVGELREAVVGGHEIRD